MMGGIGWVPAAAVVVAGLILVRSGAAEPEAPFYAEGPPPGHTGGFGEPTCHVCHGEYPLDLEGGSVAVEGFPEAYRPGETYVFTVVLRSSEMAVAGFQLALRHADGSQAGHIRAVDSRTEVRDSAGVSFVQQTEAGSEVSSAETASWSFEWVAPANGERVRLDLAANSANGDNSPFGDLVYSVSRESSGGA